MPCPVSTDVAQAAEILKKGRLVSFPTETVYGLGANALDPQAVARIFEAKGRPHFDPLIVHIAEEKWLEQLVAEFSPAARKLTDRFWPGPLTLVLPKTDRVPDLVTSGLSTVALRMPDHPLALQLLKTADLPVAAPSANLFGQLSPTRAEDVADQLGNRIDFILDGGPCRVGVESTVLQLTTDALLLLRPGGTPLEDIEAVLGPVSIAQKSNHPSAQAPASPGMLPRHYAPRTPLTIVPDASLLDDQKSFQSFLDNLPSEQKQSLQRPTPRIGLLTLQPVSSEVPFAAVEVLSPTGDLTEAAARFFAALHRLDALQLDGIVALPFPEQQLGRALNDRLRRAAETE